MKKRMLSVLIVLCSAIVVVLLFAQNHISGKRIADIIEEGDIDWISVEKWQVVDSELVLTGSNEYAYNGDELVHDISQLKLKNIHTKPVYNMQESNERCIIQFLKDVLIFSFEIYSDRSTDLPCSCHG